MNKFKQQESWNDSDRIGFWIYTEYKHPKRMQFAIINNGMLSSKVEFTREAGMCHQWKEINISGLPRDRVEAIRFYPHCRNIDGLVRYKGNYHEQKQIIN